MAHDIRSDTVLTRDQSQPRRFYAEIPDAWKVMYVFGGVSMYAALRAMQEALDRADLPLVTANAIFLAPVPPGPITIDVDVLRNGRRASQVAADLRLPGGDGPALRVHGVFGMAHDTEISYEEVRFPEVPRPDALPPPPVPERPNPFGEINFHKQTDWKPVSPLDEPVPNRSRRRLDLEERAFLGK
jgi:acyl-CoA thioesterase